MKRKKQPLSPRELLELEEDKALLNGILAALMVYVFMGAVIALILLIFCWAWNATA